MRRVLEVLATGALVAAFIAVTACLAYAAYRLAKSPG